MIYIYLLSVIIYVFSLITSRQNILSPFVFFGLLSFIYCFFPWMYINSNENSFFLSWDDLNIQSSITILLLQTLSNFFLCWVMYKPISRNLISSIENKESIIKGKGIFWYIYPISLYFSYYFPWPQFGEELTTGNSIAAFLKIFLLILFCIYCKSSNSFKKFFAFMAFVFLCVIDTSRTILLILVTLYAFNLDISWKKLFKYSPFIISAFLIFLWISLNRNGINFEPKYITWVFYTESIFGSYSTFQSIGLVNKGLVPVTFFLYPIIDMFVTLIPNIFFNIFGVVKADVFLIDNFFTRLFENGLLSEKIAPMGGHFYISEFYLDFRYFTPIFIGLYYYLFMKLIEKMRYKEIAVVFYCSSFLLIKSPFLINFKFFLSIYIISYIILIFFKVLHVYSKTVHKLK